MKLGYTIELIGEDYFVDDKKCEHRVSRILKTTRQCDDYSGVDTFYRDMGTATALAIQLDLAGDLLEDSVDPSVAPRLAAWRAFMKETGYEPSVCELSLYSQKDDFCGTLDHFGRLKGKRVVIDTKCSKTPKKWWKKQLHAYRRLLGEHGETVDELHALLLKEDATYELIPYGTQPLELWDHVMGLYRNELLEDKRRKHG